MVKSIIGKLFFRSILKNKLSYFIMIAGFTIGLACAILTFMYLYNELGYDSIFAKKDKIFRISVTSNIADREIEFAANAPAVGPAIKAAIPEIRNYTRINNEYPKAVIKTDKINNLFVSNLFVVDSGFLDVFDFPVLFGNKAALKEPNMIVLTKTLAETLFGNADPVGKLITLNFHQTLSVGAVVLDPPKNCHLRFQGLISWVTLNDEPVWDDAHSYTYFQVDDHTDNNVAVSKIKSYLETNSYVKEVEKAIGAKFAFIFQPLGEIHLKSHRLHELSENNDPGVLYVFGSIGVFLLVISCFNYVNISIANSLARSKEVGLKKVFGANSNGIKLQFFIESFIVILFSFLLALVFAFLLLNQFSQLVRQEISVHFLLSIRFFAWIVLLILVTTLLSAIYPSIYLASTNPAVVFNKSSKGGKVPVKQFLTVLQLVISSTVISCTLLALGQFRYITRADIGFDMDKIILFNIPDPGKSVYFKDQVQKVPEIEGVAMSNYSPLSPLTNEYLIEQENSSNRIFNVERMSFDQLFVSLLRIKMLTGRSFDASFASDQSKAFVVNETAVKFFGWKNPIGKHIQSPDSSRSGTVIGVMQDASFFSLHQKKAPVIASMAVDSAFDGELMFVKYKTANPSKALDKLRDIYTSTFPEMPFSYSFLDETYNTLYQADKRYERIILTGSIVMVFISCLGLFGLSSLIAIRRSNEIGIRKVLGASDTDVMKLHVRGFMKIGLLASVISWPISYYASWKWLQTFSMRSDISVWIFVFTTALILLVVMFTTAFHAFRLARVNPAVTLKV